MTEPKESGVMFLWGIVKDGVIDTPELAVKMAELLLAAHYGADKMERQKPLVATDQSETWRVEGSLNRDRSVEGEGSATFVIRKRDGRIFDLAIPTIRFTPPEVRDMLRKP